MIVTLRRLLLTHRTVWSCVGLHMYVVDAYVCGISGQNSLKGGGGGERM